MGSRKLSGLGNVHEVFVKAEVLLGNIVIYDYLLVINH
jgi:hypothetical protein